jgi:site-specific recombinase XerD
VDRFLAEKIPRYQIKLADIDLSERVLTVREGKGGKDRYVPFSEVAALFMKKYIYTARKR